MPPLEEVRDMLLWAVLPAMVAAAIVLAALEWVGGAKMAPAASALAFIVGAVLGLWLRAAEPFLSHETPWPSLNALQAALTVTGGESVWNRLPWAILAVLGVERVARCLDIHTSDGWFLRGSAALGIAWWIIPENVRDEIAWLAPAFAAVVFVEWVVLERVTAEPADGGAALCLAFTFVAAGVVLLFAGIARWMDVAVVIAAALAGIGLIAFWRRVDISGVSPAAAVVLPTLLLMGKRETVVEAIPWYVYAIVVAAPLMLAGAAPLRDRSGPLRHVMRLILVLIPLIAALVITRLAAGPLDLGHNEDW